MQPSDQIVAIVILVVLILAVAAALLVFRRRSAAQRQIDATRYREEAASRAASAERLEAEERAERAQREQEQADELAEMARRDRELAEKRSAQAEKLDPDPLRRIGRAGTSNSVIVGIRGHDRVHEGRPGRVVQPRRRGGRRGPQEDHRGHRGGGPDGPRLEDEPQYLVRSEKSGGEAVHKASALKKR